MRLFRAITILLFLSLLIPKGNCQLVVHEFSESFSFGSSDPLGHFYLVKGNQLRKIDSLSNTLHTYSNASLGEISSIDTSDPFRLLLYYKSFNQVQFLDRTLSPIGDPIKLDELDIFTPSGICRAKQGGLWLVDSNENSLILLDNNLDITSKINLSLPGGRSDDQWFPMLEWKNGLYICIPENKVVKFDLFGKLLRTTPLKASSIQAKDNNLIICGTAGVFLYQDSPFNISGPLKLNFPAWEQLIFSKNFALIKSDNSWILYRIKKTSELPE